MVYAISSRFQPISVDMEVSTSIIKQAELKHLAARIITIAVFPFLLIASFEAVVINGLRTLANLAIFVLNAAHSCWFPNELIAAPGEAPQFSLPLEPSEQLSTPALSIIEMMPAEVEHREKVEWIVKTLGTASVWNLWQTHKNDLESKGKDIEQIHPFQFLEVIFGRYSTIKHHMTSIMSRNIIPGRFLEGLEKGFCHPVYEHHKKASAYLPSFAQQVGATTTQDKVHKLLFPKRKWEALVKHLMRTNKIPIQ